MRHKYNFSDSIKCVATLEFHCVDVLPSLDENTSLLISSLPVHRKSSDGLAGRRTDRPYMPMPTDHYLLLSLHPIDPNLQFQHFRNMFSRCRHTIAMWILVNQRSIQKERKSATIRCVCVASSSPRDFATLFREVHVQKDERGRKHSLHRYKKKANKKCLILYIDITFMSSSVPSCRLFWKWYCFLVATPILDRYLRRSD